MALKRRSRALRPQAPAEEGVVTVATETRQPPSCHVAARVDVGARAGNPRIVEGARLVGEYSSSGRQSAVLIRADYRRRCSSRHIAGTQSRSSTAIRTGWSTTGSREWWLRPTDFHEVIRRHGKTFHAPADPGIRRARSDCQRPGSATISCRRPTRPLPRDSSFASQSAGRFGSSYSTREAPVTTVDNRPADTKRRQGTSARSRRGYAASFSSSPCGRASATSARRSRSRTSSPRSTRTSSRPCDRATPTATGSCSRRATRASRSTRLSIFATC